jgi:hypothetical protein
MASLSVPGSWNRPEHSRPHSGQTSKYRATSYAANVILHPLFLLLRVFDNAKPPEGSGCLLLSPSTPAVQQDPHFNRRKGVRFNRP